MLIEMVASKLVRRDISLEYSQPLRKSSGKKERNYKKFSDQWSNMASRRYHIQYTVSGKVPRILSLTLLKRKYELETGCCRSNVKTTHSSSEFAAVRCRLCC